MRQLFPLPFIGFIAVLLVIPGIREYATASKWSFLAVAVAVSVCFTKIRWSPGYGVGLCLLLWSALSLLWSPVWQDGLQGLAWLLIMAGAFILGGSAKDLRLFYLVTSLAFIPSAINMALFKFTGVYVSFGMFPAGGTLGNPNFAGEAAAAIAASALGVISLRRSFPRLIAVSPALATMLLSGCRGAIVAFGAMGLCRLWRVSPLAVALLFLAGMIGLGFTLGSQSRRDALTQRAMIYRDTIDGLTFFGRGIGQYRAMVPEKGHRLSAISLNTEHAHNDLLEIAFELGFPGIVLFAWLCFTAVRARSDGAEPYVLGSLLVAGLFGFPLFEPVASFLFAVVAGHLCAAGARLRNELDWSAGHPGAGVQRLAATLADGSVTPGGFDVSARLAGSASGGRHGGDAGAVVAAGNRAR
jgi:O-antigen ligase/polysaccharide polymerase Wzy-like membrane protein